MGCTTCSGNPNTWCTQCMPAEDTWVAPVDKLPDVFMGDRDHMYLLPNGDLYILSPDRTRWIKVNGQGGGATYDDTKVINRLKALEGKTDNFISSVNVSRNGNRVKLTYTLVDGTIKEVEFEDKDTVALAYDDTALKARVKALEDKPVTPTGVNTFFAKGDIPGNGNAQNVTVTKDKLVNADTIKVGDTVVDSYWDKTNFNIGMFKVASVNGNDVVLNGVNDLTYKQPKQSLTLADRTLSISEGNSVTLPNDKQTISRQGNKLVLSNGGGEVDLPTPNNATPYDDTFLRGKITALENKPDNDKQTLAFNETNRNLSISNGNTVNLPDYLKKEDAYKEFPTYPKLQDEMTKNIKDKHVDLGLDKLIEDKLQNGQNPYVKKGDVPALSGANFFVAKGDIPGNKSTTINKGTIYNDETIKVGDTVRDKFLNPDTGELEYGYWKVTAVTDTTVTVEPLGTEKDIINDRQGGMNLLNKYCGYGYVTREKIASNYTVSHPFYFKDGMSLKQLGYNVGDKIKVAIDKLHSPLKGFPANARITVELYDETKGTNGQYLTYITGQNLTRDMELRGEHTITDQTINANSIRLRIDNFQGDREFVRFRNIMVYKADREYKDFIEPSGSQYEGRTNYLTNTRTLTGAQVALGKHDVDGFTYIRATGGGAYVDPFNQKVDIPMATGWYTVRFKARAKSGTVRFLNYLYEGSGVKFVVNSQGEIGNPGDGSSPITADTTLREYWISWFISNDNPVTPKVLLGRLQNLPSTSEVEIGEISLIKGCHIGYWVGNPKDNMTDNSTVLNDFNTLKAEYNQLKGAFTALLQNLKNSGAWNQTGNTIFEGSLRPDRNIATGNINLFGGTVDGNAFIRTNNGKTENDLAGGIN